MVYGVYLMRRTNIYLDDAELEALRSMGNLQGRPMAEIVREAVHDWLRRHGAQQVPDDDWRKRLGQLLDERGEVAATADWDLDDIERDVATAVAEVRRERAASRR